MAIYSRNKHESLESAMKKMLYDIKKNGHKTSPRGRSSYELIGYEYTLTNPLKRLVAFPIRKLNLYFAIGNFLWVTQQSNKLEIIKYYNPKGINFSDDGEILRGAYGKRIFDFDGVNQFHQCVKELKLDPNSRRAVITFHLPQHDWAGSLDTPCTCSIQFFIRDNKLHMVNHMRSQSSAFVMPYDVFLMTMLQELMANELEVELGSYQHFCGSAHYFENEKEFVNNLLNEDINNYSNGMPRMNGVKYNDLKPLFYFEREIREYAVLSKKINRGIIVNDWLEKLESIKLNEYSYNLKQFGLILISKAIDYVGEDNTLFIKKYIDDEYAKILLNSKK